MKTIESKTHCVNAYLNLSVHPSGIVRPCCMNTSVLKTDSGKKNLHEASILEFWNGKERQQLIEDLENGIQVKECASCWKEELSGKDSKRIRDNKNYKDIELKRDMLPVVVDLAMGNLCNLKCRICAPTHSSPWMIEEAQLYFPDDNKKYLHMPQWKISKESFDQDNEFFWKDIFSLLPNVKKLDFAGGEPFYIDKHWDIVNACVENGWSKHQHIHYNTNGTIFPKKYIHLLESFNIVDIQISSDGVGKKFEYMRHPANWQEVESNINEFVECKNRSKAQWFLSMCVSISAFNVFDFFETFEYYHNKGLGIYVNIVHDHRGVKVLPPELRKIVIENLQSKKSNFSSQWEKDCNMICKHLETASFNPDDWNAFVKELQLRDRIRNESYADAFPEFYVHMEKFIG